MDIIKKLNSAKPERGIFNWRIKLGECAALVSSYHMVVADGNEGLVEANLTLDPKAKPDEESYEAAKIKILTRYETIVENAKYLYTVSYKGLKSVKDKVKVEEHFYNTKYIKPYLKNENVEVWKNDGVLLLRQSDRDIVVMCCIAEDDETINNMKEYKV